MRKPTKVQIQKSKELLSKQIQDMENAGFGFLTEVIRTAVFQNPDYEKKIYPLFLENNPHIEL